MQIILMEKVVNLGNLGDVVKVKDGFARNFLIPHGKAKRATAANLKVTPELENDRPIPDEEVERAAPAEAAAPKAALRKEVVGEAPSARCSSRATVMVVVPSSCGYSLRGRTQAALGAGPSL